MNVIIIFSLFFKLTVILAFCQLWIHSSSFLFNLILFSFILHISIVNHIFKIRQTLNGINSNTDNISFINYNLI